MVLGNNRGFTVIELLLASFILGVLTLIGVVNFDGRKAKSFEAEAKTHLASYYSAQKVMYTEFKSYHSKVDSLGFAPSGVINFNVGVRDSIKTPRKAPRARSTCTSTCPNLCSYDTNWSCSESANQAVFDHGGYTRITKSTFIAEAHGHFKGWKENEGRMTFLIDQEKTLRAIPDPQ
ncbi:MAG: prepilin-type N-terminal cleavage/methylation domain-containing protein [Bdellovibrionales bacterium]|nr:prepilin-type N-terminal cleavage/methylation domain-containing protein [Bdellovibrionales bacterium]